MKTEMSVSEAEGHLAELVEKTRLNRESTVLTNAGGEPVAVLAPVKKGPPYTGSEIAEMWRSKSWPRLSRKEADLFAKDVEEGRREMNAISNLPDSPWD